jgi:hypothetical protein
MQNKIIKVQNKQTRIKVHELLNKYSVEDPEKTNAKRTQFLAMLKKRYGYTNEKSVDELKRLLKQFYRSNMSLGIHHPRPNIENLYLE